MEGCERRPKGRPFVECHQHHSHASFSDSASCALTVSQLYSQPRTFELDQCYPPFLLSEVEAVLCAAPSMWVLILWIDHCSLFVECNHRKAHWRVLILCSNGLFGNVNKRTAFRGTSFLRGNLHAGQVMTSFSTYRAVVFIRH
jgi:hypothetical protein